jgi:4-alpha-glucanotransferase
MTRSQPGSRRAGILVPLFSIPSSSSWGIGEISDIERLAGWLESAGQRFVQLLPINELPTHERSPYSALSAMAIDPQFISVNRVEDFDAIGGEAGLSVEERQRLERVRSAGTIAYEDVRRLKLPLLHRAYCHFRDREWKSGTRRAAAFRAYLESQAWWLEEYAVFRALKARYQERAWTDWPKELRTREAHALDEAREALADDILFRKYLQWLAGDQWGEARDRTGSIALFGDLPFMVSGDSADVWARQDEFRLDASVGVPPDAFSATGQDWGLPVYRWDVLEERNFDWLRDRARRNADLYDGYRVDHLVGFYRTYFRPADGSDPEFTPSSQAAQLRLGEAVLRVFREPGTEIIAEDLGVVPDFVRESLSRLNVPGYKVFRWERDWHTPNQPFKDPHAYPPVSVATSGTHDTEPMAIWWESAPRSEREAVLQIPAIARRIADDERTRVLDRRGLSNHLREAFLETLFESGSELLILPIQDVFGWNDRINQPATVGDGNWTWRLPWPSDRLTTQPEAMAVANQLKEWAEKHKR